MVHDADVAIARPNGRKVGCKLNDVIARCLGVGQVNDDRAARGVIRGSDTLQSGVALIEEDPVLIVPAPSLPLTEHRKRTCAKLEDQLV